MRSKVPKQVSQDFFPRSANNAKTKGFIFNQAPLNKKLAHDELKQTMAEDAADSKHSRKTATGGKRSAFMAKLYDDDQLDDEMRVFDMEAADDFNDKAEQDEESSSKRQIKESSKQQKHGKSKSFAGSKSSEVSATKINRLKFNVGSLGLFAISEVHPGYLIVNYTRNTKGFISLKDVSSSSDLHEKFQVGQFIIASVLSTGTSKYNTDTSGYRNKKLQLTIALDHLNKSLTAENLATNMLLQGQIESKEAKGYLINFGLKDKTKGFLPFNNNQQFQIGSIVQVLIKSVLASSKVAKCELINQQNEEYQQYMNNKDITIHNLKPGFMVNTKISRVLENGIELGFLGGFKGTVFIDHLDKNDPSKYKVGEKLSARVIAVDPQAQSIQLSLLPHIKNITSVVDTIKTQGLHVGQIIDKAIVEKELYGGSYKIRFGKDQFGFLHKTHTKEDKEQEQQVEEEEEEEPLPGKKEKKAKKQSKKKSENEIEVGQKLEKLRIKEINYFDGVPILSMKEEILNSSALTYDDIKCGDFISALVTDINEEKKFISLKVNDFVKGRLYLEHMADFPLKVIPPKYRDLNKTLKVRVFNIDPKTRTLEFTRKDTLLKAKVQVYQSYKEVSKGSKLHGVIVAENDHGYIIKSFGGIKGLLTFADIKANSKSSKKDTSQFKIGSIVKAYVLFKKKDQGMALTLDKVKAKELREESSKNGKGDKQVNQSEKNAGRFEDYLPTEEENTSLKDKYKTFLKTSQDKTLIGKVQQFRVLEQTERYLVCKCLDAAKKSQNFVAVLPNILINKHFQPSFTLEEFTFQGIVLEITQDGFPIISSQNELITLKDTVPKQNTDISTDAINRIFTGVVSESNKSGVLLRFFDGLKKLVIIKDLETVQNFAEHYKPGKVVRCALNKLNRLCLKSSVIYLNDQQQVKRDKEVQIRSFYHDVEAQLKSHDIKIGDKVTAEISLVKDYGLIVAVEKYEGLTGFVLAEHQISGKQYKEGQKVTCVVMDIDFEKELIDLSERLAEKQKGKDVAIKSGSSQKAIVELNKEHYLIVSFKNNSKSFGIVMTQSFNDDGQENPNEKYNAGDELDLQVLDQTDTGFYLTVPAFAVSQKQKEQVKNGKAAQVSLAQGVLVNAQIKSKKHDCIFLQIQQQSQLAIGRLHRIECQNDSEFKNFSVGETIQAKVLKISQGSDKKTWIELTRRKEHMKKAQGLDQAILEKQPDSMESFKNGATYDAIITDVNYAYSQPIQISLTPFVRGQISFDRIITCDTLEKEGSSILQKYSPGAQVKATYHNGQFGIVEQQGKGKLQKGSKVLVRYVKAVYGKGITVQINEKTFGFIAISEITDDIIGNVLQSQQQTSPLFVARVIAFDKHDKPVLSSRESVIDDSKWALIGPEGKSVHFQKFDEKNQRLGNQRNKILKFKSNVALQEGDLCLGYVTNIGKSGCFIQVGHESTVRAGLNELSDESSYDFQEQMPLGRLVLCRIVKVDESNGQKRFNVTLRRSLVVYGTNAVEKNALQPEAQVECIVMALADGKVFAQVKGSYHKLKIKNAQKGIKIGDHVIAQLEKVTKQKITGTFVEKVRGAGRTEQEKQIDKLWQLVEEESQKDIEAQRDQAHQQQQDAELIRNLGNVQDEIEEQIKDLNELQRDDDEDMEDVQDDGSDEEEMQRIIQESKVYDDNDEDEEEDEDVDMEEVDEDDQDNDLDDSEEEGSDDDSDSDGDKKKKSGKQSLKQRIKEEQQIRKKEQALKDNKEQPKTVDDFERLIVQNKDQSYVWIQYIAFMLDKLGIESARKVAERAVKSVSISNEEDKFNLWVAYMNLENNFGTQETLEKVVKRALEVNDRKRIYLQLISIYQASQKYQYIEDIYKSLCKKYNTSFKIWAAYLEFLFTMKDLKKDKSNFIVRELEFSEPQQVLKRILQSLPKDEHVNIISKFGQLEFKHGQPESGRTMFEGIVSNYPKRMDIWAIYMDMESKYCGDNKQQARHLFERCLTNDFILKKPKKMKLVFQKYMEFEMNHGNKKNVDKLRERVEKYLENAFNKNEDKGSDSEMSE